MKAESLVPMTDPTNGTNSLKPGVSKYEIKAEDGDVIAIAGTSTPWREYGASPGESSSQGP